MSPRPVLPLVAAACAGIAAWVSMGTLAVAEGDSGLVRFGLLPPLWLLPALVGAFIVLAWALRLSAPIALPLFFSLVLVLPWIPGSVPTAFLLWTGPVTVGVWVAVVAAAAIAHGIRLPALLADPKRAPRLAAAAACALYIGSAWWLANILPGGDEPHYLVVTQSLLKDHDLQIENNHARGDYLEYFGGPLQPHSVRRGTNGQIYSIHAPGLSAVVAPAYALGGYHGVVIFLSIIAAMGSALLWLASYRLTGSSSAAWFAWAVWALTVPFVFEAFAVYPDGAGATLVLFAALPLIERASGVNGAGGANGVSRRQWIATGTALALLPWLHTRFAVIAAVLGLFLSLRLIGTAEGRARLGAFLAVPVVSAMAWFGFFRAVYGTFNPAAPYGGDTQTAFINIANGLPALLFDQQFGIVPNAPVYLFCFAGMVVLAKSRPRLAVELSLTAAPYLLAATSFHMWWAGSSAPARFAVPVLPLLVLPGAWLWTTSRDRATRALAVVALVSSVAMTVLLVSVDDGRLAYNVREEMASRAMAWLNPSVDLASVLPSFFRAIPSGAELDSGLRIRVATDLLARAGLWLASIAFVWFALRFIERETPRELVRSVLSLAAPALAAIAVMVTVSSIWRSDGASPLTPELSQLSLLGRYDARIRPQGIELAPIRLVPAEAVLSRLAISTPSRMTPSSRTLLRIPGVVPAGRYELRPVNRGVMTGTAMLTIGRVARPILKWNLQESNGEFELPVNIGGLDVQGDDDAVRTTGGLVLHPQRLDAPASLPTTDYARRVERYGPGLVYFFDDGAFVEEPGFWVRGGGEARIAVAPVQSNAGLSILVRNAAVPNRVELEMDGQSQTLHMQPSEEQVIPVTSAGGRPAVLVRIRPETGFRPSLVEPGSTDTRFLGAWIALVATSNR